MLPVFILLGQERFLILTTPMSYETRVRDIFGSSQEHGFSAATIYIDEFHETKSFTAACPKNVISLKKRHEAIVQELYSLHSTRNEDEGIRSEDEDGSEEIEDEEDWFTRNKPKYLAQTPYVCGFSGTPRMNFQLINENAVAIELAIRGHGGLEEC